MHHLKFFILILSLFTHRLIFLRKGLALSFAMLKQIESMFMKFPEITTGIFKKNRVKLLQGHIGTLNISCKKKKKNEWHICFIKFMNEVRFIDASCLIS